MADTTSLQPRDNMLPKGSLILVTGANGYIASHICNQLLKHGYRVRGTVRDEQRSSWLLDRFGGHFGRDRFELVTVKDFTQEGCFDEAMKDCSAVCATAGDFSMQDSPHEVVPAAIQSIRNTLTSAARNTGIKRFVLTSSSHTVRNYMRNQQLHITPDSWSMEAVEIAYRPPPYGPTRKFAVYSAVKVRTEQEAWRFVKEEKPAFTLNTIVPNSNLGAILEPRYQRAITGRWVEGMYKNDWDMFKPIPPQWFIDVEDNALLHVAALTDLSIANERILGFSQPYNWNDVLKTLKKLRPDHRWPELLQDDTHPLFTVDNGRGREIMQREFGRDLKTLEQSLEEALKSLGL